MRNPVLYTLKGHEDSLLFSRMPQEERVWTPGCQGPGDHLGGWLPAEASRPGVFSLPMPPCFFRAMTNHLNFHIRWTVFWICPMCALQREPSGAWVEFDPVVQFLHCLTMSGIMCLSRPSPGFPYSSLGYFFLTTPSPQTLQSSAFSGPLMETGRFTLLTWP